MPDQRTAETEGARRSILSSLHWGRRSLGEPQALPAATSRAHPSLEALTRGFSQDGEVPTLSSILRNGQLNHDGFSSLPIPASVDYLVCLNKGYNANKTT